MHKSESENDDSHLGVAFQYSVLAVFDIGAKLLGFAVTIIALRHFGATGLGGISLAQSITIVGIMVASCGLDLYGVTSISGNARPIRNLVGSVISIRVVFGTIALGIISILAFAVPRLQEIQWLVWLFGFSILTNCISVSWVAQATKKPLVYGLASFSTQAIYLGLVLLGLSLFSDQWIIPLSLVLAEFVVAIGLILWMGFNFGFPRLPSIKQELAELKNIVKESIPIGSGKILRAVSLGSDYILIGFLMSNSFVGIYTGIYKLFTFGMSLVFLYCVLLLPRLSERHTESIATVTRELLRSLARTLPFGAVAVGAGCLMASPVLSIVYSPLFAEFSSVLRILVVTLLFYIVSVQMQSTLLALGEQRKDFGNVCIASAVHVVAKIVLIPLFGIAGAAWGTLLGEITLCSLGTVSVVLLVRERKYQYETAS